MGGVRKTVSIIFQERHDFQGHAVFYCISLSRGINP